MNKKLNAVLLNRKDAIFVNRSKEDNSLDDYKNAALIATASRNLECLGYKMSSTLACELLYASVNEIVETASFLVDAIKHKLGGDVEYHPMYPGFPDSVINRTEAQLYFDALLYALSGFKCLPVDETEVKVEKMSRELSKLKTIDLANVEIAKNIASNLMSSSVAFSQDDKNDLLIINDNFENFKEFIPSKIPNKENLTWLAAEYMKKMKPTENPFVDKLNSATDILRLIVARNGGDTSLTEPVKFKSLPNSEMKVYAIKLAYMKGAEPEMYQRIELFKKLSESYHFRNIKDMKVQAMLDKLYSKSLERSFFSKRDYAIQSGDYKKLLDLYKSAPGQMGADLSRLALLATEQPNYYLAKTELCNTLRMNAKQISSLNLLKANALLKDRTKKKEYSVYSPKKGLANPWLQPDDREPLPKDLVNSISSITKYNLEERYAKKRPLGKVYIEKNLKDVKIPSQQRTNSAGSSGMSFGSKFPIDPEINCLRSFIWWTNSGKNNNYHVDIDLSATIYDKDLNGIVDIAYYNLSVDKVGVHSGDLRDGGPAGGKGAAEFIDINLDVLNTKYSNAAYVMFTVNIYNGESFAETQCKFGWMESDHSPQQLFDITKVEKAIELNTDSTRSIPVLFDIHKKKMIWLDRNPRQSFNFSIKNLNALHGGNNNITYASSLMVEAYRAIHASTPDLYTLMEIHANARGEIVDTPEEADTLFTVERVKKDNYPNAKEFVCAYDHDEILGDLISDELSFADLEYFKEVK
jgi:hypothetical protein